MLRLPFVATFMGNFMISWSSSEWEATYRIPTTFLWVCARDLASMTSCADWK